MKKPDYIKKNIHAAIENVRKGSESVLTGLTGGIAAGKSTVAEMFRTLGAVIIDFDILARRVVEPGSKSYELISNFFGKEILNPDKTINRKRLSGIAFNDQVKREQLESFTHPYIWDEFITLTGEAISRDKKAIILAVIPLLIEGGMQDIFSRVILVYSSPETQVSRLMERDGISREMARKILDAQMPIDEKVRYGDFIIINEGSIEDTKNDVGDIWDELKHLQSGRKV